MKGKYPSVIFVLVLLLSAITNYPGVAALTIKVGYPQLSGGTMPLWVINDAKLDRRRPDLYSHRTINLWLLRVHKAGHQRSPRSRWQDSRSHHQGRLLGSRS